MKKLLLLAVLTLGVIACDKNELGNMDSMSINPIEAKVDMNYQDRFNAFDALIRGIKIDSKSTASSNKGGDNGDNWIELAWFNHDSQGYIYGRPDDLGNGCYNDISGSETDTFLETWTYDIANNSVNIQIADGTGNSFDLAAADATLYTNAFASGTSFIFLADLTNGSWVFNPNGLPSATVND